MTGSTRTVIIVFVNTRTSSRRQVTSRGTGEALGVMVASFARIVARLTLSNPLIKVVVHTVTLVSGIIELSKGSS